MRTIEHPAKAPGYDTPIPCRALEVRTGRTGRLRRGAPRSRSPRGPRPGGDLTSGKGRIPRGHHLGRPPGPTAPRPRHQRPLSPLEPRPLLLLRYPDGSPKRPLSPARRPIEACRSRLRRLRRLRRLCRRPCRLSRRPCRPRPVQRPHWLWPRRPLQQGDRPQQRSREVACHPWLGGAPQQSGRPLTCVRR